MKKILFILFVLFSFSPFAQDSSTSASFDENVNSAYTNAMKGVYFALENIPESKSSMSADLIEDDKLLAEMKLTKEINGVKVESKGFYETYSVEIVIYRSYDSLEAEGYR